ncbi:MAG TPA: sigma-54 dependent transcriptional regulator [Thermoanaerobaculia bacterium]|nr:sigma-54 dependent transcriptional regulator [Thermoanaerobaculia bacterium]
MHLIGVIEDDETIGVNIVLRLREEGYGVTLFRRAEEALAWLEAPANVRPDMLLIDVRLPGMTGVELLRRLGEDAPPSVILSGAASMGETLEAIRLGVHDFIDKPFTTQRLVQSVRNCLRFAELRRQLDAFQDDEQQILGNSAPIRELRATIAKVAPTNARVLIRGESGSGKELVGAALHRLSPRRAHPFVTINCAAIPETLIEDELFGHVRGAFTDARHARAGLFEQAHHGTLFLDEIGDMDRATQSRLLRVLEDGRVRRVGDVVERAVDVRVIAATNRDLESMVRSGAFREDLYFRIASVPVDVPPLRERKDDIPLLLTSFLRQLSRRQPLTFDEEVFARLRAYRWPGNVRELRNLAERLSVFGTDPITVEQLPSSLMSDGPESGVVRLEAAAPVVPLRAFRVQCEKEYIEAVLHRARWNITRAAELLEMRRTHLHQKMNALGIRREAEVPR